MADLLTAALEWQQAGFSVVPARADGSKAPHSTWKQYMATAADGDQIVEWFALGAYDGLGVICGEVSNNLELLEWEGRAVAEGLVGAWSQAMTDHGQSSLAARLMNGYVETTPSGGFHILYRVQGASARNTKLASRPATDAELAQRPGKVKVLIETRGEGGFVVTAPSGGRTHPTGGEWKALIGSPRTVPMVTVQERDTLYEISQLLDQMPTAPPISLPPTTPPPDAGERPGDDYNAKAAWTDLLSPRGWKILQQLSGGEVIWQRPGKDHGPSATTGANEADNLYVFSRPTEFEQEKPYSKFAALALLEHFGDLAACAKRLRLEGYGVDRPLTRLGGMDQLAGVIAPAALAAMIPPPPAGPPTAPPTPGSAPAGSVKRALTDLGNAERLADRFADRLAWATDAEAWLSWGGKTWDNESSATFALRAAVETVRHIIDEADLYSDTPNPNPLGGKDKPSDRANLVAWSIGSQAESRIAAVLKVGKGQPRLARRMADFDANRMMLNVGNGVLDLATGLLAPHEPRWLFTQLAPVSFDPDAQCPSFTAFLERVHPDEDVRAYLARIIGYSLTGSTQEQVMFIHHGSGANGKSVFLEVLNALLGSYAQVVPESTLISKANDTAIPTDVARMTGKRLLLAAEMAAGRRLNEPLLRQLIAGDTTTARHPYGRFFDFQPTGKIHLATNHLPHLASGGHGTERRIRDIGWAVTIPQHEQDRGLAARIIAQELPGVLAWALRGCLQWQALGGLATPQAVIDKTAEHMQDADPLAEWIITSLRPADVMSEVLTTKLYEDYANEARDGGERPMSLRSFSQALEERGYRKQRTTDKQRRSVFIGLALVPKPFRTGNGHLASIPPPTFG